MIGKLGPSSLLDKVPPICRRSLTQRAPKSSQPYPKINDSMLTDDTDIH